MSASTKMPDFLAVDFYCGVGGTTRGLLDAGGYVICGIDKDETNRTSYKDNNRNTTLDRRNRSIWRSTCFLAAQTTLQGNSGKSGLS